MDDCSEGRLVLSGEEDWKEVHRLRAQCDAILVGAETIRRDNPSLTLKDPVLRTERERVGRPADITKVTVSGSGKIDTAARFFTTAPQAEKIVVLGSCVSHADAGRLGSVAKVIMIDNISAAGIVSALEDEGIASLLVEGGPRTLKMFIDEQLLDEMRLSVLPRPLADVESSDANQSCNAPQMPYFGSFPFSATTAQVLSRAGEMDVAHYFFDRKIFETDERLLLQAIHLSRNSPPCSTAYRVGAVVVTRDGKEFTGFTHETSPDNHAEEEAILKALAASADLTGATIYSSMEPCSTRRSKPVSCSELIIGYRIARVVYAYAEPACLADCQGTSLLTGSGIEVTVLPWLGPQVEEINTHIIGVRQ